MRRFPLVLGLVVALVGCEDEPDRLSFTLSLDGDISASSAGRPFSSGSLAEPSADGRGLVIDLHQPIHWIEVEHCLDRQCTPFGHGDYCYFENAEIAWETAMGEEPVGYGFDDLLRGPPKITGEISYGVKPKLAGWQSEALPLIEGERYGLNVFVHEDCNDGGGDEWLCTAAIGCQYFTIQNGKVVPYEPGRDD